MRADIKGAASAAPTPSPETHMEGKDGWPITSIDILREWFGGERYARDHEYLDANYGRQAQQVVDWLASAAPSPLPNSTEVERLRAALSVAWVRMRNARGAVESNQVVDKDVRGTLTRGIEEIDAVLSHIPSPQTREVG